MNTATLSDCITLYYRQGGSDKIYQVAIEPFGPGFAVNFAFGRRGSTLQTGSKTPAPVGYDDALKIYDKLVREKTAKGYTPGEDGTAYQHTDKEERVTGVLPQLLNAIDESEAENLLCDPAWITQEKLDGKRTLLRRIGDNVIGINRSGLVIGLPDTIVECALKIPCQQFALDGECIGEKFIAFDLLEKACVNLRPEPYRKRLDTLYCLPVIGPDQAIQFIQTARKTAEKRAMVIDLRKQNREGVVFKRHDAPYIPGRPASGGTQLKLKFHATASCVVAGINGSKRSVKLEMVDGARRISIGNVTIPANQSIPIAGQVAEVRYLYAYPGGSLYQPVYLGVRDDIAVSACVVSQLKFKPDSEEEDPS